MCVCVTDTVQSVGIKKVCDVIKNAWNRKLFNRVAPICSLIFSDLPLILIVIIPIHFVSLAYSVIFLIEFKGSLLRRWSLNRTRHIAV